VEIRPLVPGDVDAVAEADFAACIDVALRHGVSPLVRAVRDSRASVKALLDADPLGGFVAVDGGRVVGHAWAHARTPIATIGPIAVEPSAQRRGVGRALLAHCIQAAGARTAQVRLVQPSFDTASLALFLAEGFRVVAPLLELALDGPAAAAPPPAQLTIRAATAGDQPRIVARDARAFGAQRAQDVERHVRANRALVAERGQAFAGYALAGPGRLGAAAGDDPAIVLALLAVLAADEAVAATSPRVLVLATDRALLDGLRAMGFRLFRACHYMLRGGGTAPPPGYVLMGPYLL
jgi:predicted N-acetyltransferase YhbS